ncbi:MAG: hypothetical protein ACI86S_001323 [Paracoccaceae bacterium]
MNKKDSRAMNRLHYYCLAHAPPRFRLDPRITVIGLGSKGVALAPESSIFLHAYDLVPDLAGSHRWLGGSLGSFAVRRHLAQIRAAASDRVCISHYRRFVLPQKFGRDDENSPGVVSLPIDVTSDFGLRASSWGDLHGLVRKN